MKKPTDWAWTEDRNVESEQWHAGGGSRASAIKTAREARFKTFVIAPCRPATKRDVRDWCGENDLCPGDMVVDSDHMEFFPKERNRKL